MNCTYYPNYFSIDDIVVTQEKVPCVTEQVSHISNSKTATKNITFLTGSCEPWLFGPITSVSRSKG